MADYTHRFQLNVGSINILGDCEFNEDNQVSFETDEALPSITVDQLKKINLFFVVLEQIFKEFGSITKIEVEES